jgi:hypothetical protein
MFAIKPVAIDILVFLCVLKIACEEMGGFAGLAMTRLGDGWVTLSERRVG